jgi:hypothetical protein
MARRALVCLAFLSLVAVCPAQARFAGKGQYPQSRSLSGLSGGGRALRSDGVPSTKGALALSTPIAYTIADSTAVVIGGTTSADGSLRWFDGAVASNGSNGSAALVFGTSFGDVRAGVSLVQTSRLSEDRVVHLQLSPIRSTDRLRLAAGAQDLLDQTVTTPDYFESTRSLFVVASYDAGSTVFLSAGIGTKRFANGFASASAPLFGPARFVVENDGFGWNYGVEVGLSRASVFIGSCQGRYATWALSLRF